MAKSPKRISPEGVDRNGLALLVFIVAAVVGYAVAALLMAAILESSGEALPRDSLWKVFVYWAIVMAPQLVGIIAGLAAVHLFVVRFNRSFLFYVTVGLGIVVLCLFSLFMLFPATARSMLLVVLQFATAWIGFVILRRSLRRQA